MNPRRSKRVDSRQNGVSKPRGIRGFHRFKNGLFNVAPIGDERIIGRKYSEDSPLLCLPREIRDAIWEYTLSSPPIKMQSPRPGRPMTDFFPLIRVCRQIYTETALLPYILNAFFFFRLRDISDWRKTQHTGNMAHMRKIIVRESDLISSIAKCRFNFDLADLKSLEEIEITYHYKPNTTDGDEVERIVREYFKKNKVTFHVMKGSLDWYNIWRGEKDF